MYKLLTHYTVHYHENVQYVQYGKYTALLITINSTEIIIPQQNK